MSTKQCAKRNYVYVYVYRGMFAKDVQGAEVLEAIAKQGRRATFVLPSNHIIGMSDHHLLLSRLLDSPPLREKRMDLKDGNSYTREEFLVYYGVLEARCFGSKTFKFSIVRVRRKASA